MTDEAQPQLLDWATSVTRDYVQGIAETNQGVSKEALRAAAASLAEIGISTDKLHARGPMGIRELTTWKFEIVGQGQVRG